MADVRCYGSIRTWPPYVGGDDDAETEWYQAECACGWKDEQRSIEGVTETHLIRHLNRTLATLRGLLLVGPDQTEKIVALLASDSRRLEITNDPYFRGSVDALKLVELILAPSKPSAGSEGSEK